MLINLAVDLSLHAVRSAHPVLRWPRIALDRAAKSVSPTWRRFKDALRRHPTAIVGGVVLLLMILIAIFAPWLGTVDPQAVSPIRRLKPPSAEYWFGTDMLGRDVYSRVLYGARVSLIVGLAVALFSTLVGLAIGLVTGYIRWLDAIVMRDHGRADVDPVGAARDRADGADHGEHRERDRSRSRWPKCRASCGWCAAWC